MPIRKTFLTLSKTMPFSARLPHLLMRGVICFICLAALYAKEPRGKNSIAHVVSADELKFIRPRLGSPSIARIAAPYKINSKQVFALESKHKSAMYVVPVRFNSFAINDTTRTSFRCGLFIVPHEGTAMFFPTIGYGNSEPVQCDELKAVGFLATSEDMPVILMLYEGSTPNADTKGFVVFSWNAIKGAYFENEDLEDRLPDDGSIKTIAQVKRFIRAHHLR